MPIQPPRLSQQPLGRELLSDQAYAVIKQLIIDDVLPPGSRLVESQLARELNVSQAPMREALKRLTHEGLVTHVPRRGSFVTEVSAAEATQMREVRAGLEEMAARFAAKNVPDASSRRLRQIVTQMRKAAGKRDVNAFRGHDVDFHRTVVEASGNMYLPRLWLQIEPSLRTMFIISNPRFAGDWNAMARSHADLITVLETADPDVAARRFGDHARGHATTQKSPAS